MGIDRGISMGMGSANKSRRYDDPCVMNNHFLRWFLKLWLKKILSTGDLMIRLPIWNAWWRHHMRIASVSLAFWGRFNKWWDRWISLTLGQWNGPWIMHLMLPLVLTHTSYWPNTRMVRIGDATMLINWHLRDWGRSCHPWEKNSATCTDELYEIQTNLHPSVPALHIELSNRVFACGTMLRKKTHWIR